MTTNLDINSSRSRCLNALEHTSDNKKDEGNGKETYLCIECQKNEADKETGYCKFCFKEYLKKCPEKWKTVITGVTSEIK